VELDLSDAERKKGAIHPFLYRLFLISAFFVINLSIKYD